ncbi:MAG: hypothetical protein A3I68_03500 [Candidatus Melainabacteria bacterium RIFCSPLOWO2_02_FULL_35_15]|nr:MAG: hypothetical protein A3F80_03820 [Candidatus Melainabacteria bacterium RIFCSPLOWO2_12_FULL_35_11]OGI14668.1 MAG: hypothetical protein A3I68_03500 [Candidatus Melainabacteria bacterium RIFCSPLOWO2_02_FULL_35_15]
MSYFTIILISLCTFGSIFLILLAVYRMKQISSQSNEINKRLKFWLSEKSIGSQGTGYAEEQPDKDESFARRVLVPLGEQVGNWMAEKVPYNKQSQARKLLIRAGFRSKKALQFFYAIKFTMAVVFAGGFLFVCSVFGKDVQAALGLAFIAGIFGFIGTNFIVDKIATGRQQNIDRVLPDALDLLVICTEAGMGIDQALLRVASNLGEKGKDLTEEIALTNRELNLGQERALCWNNFGERANSEELKNLARVIVQSEKVGASIGAVLKNQSEFLRVRRKQKAEEKAAQMTIKMMIPLALFIFPVIMAVTMGPPIVKLVSTLGKMS